MSRCGACSVLEGRPAAVPPHMDLLYVGELAHPGGCEQHYVCMTPTCKTRWQRIIGTSQDLGRSGPYWIAMPAVQAPQFADIKVQDTTQDNGGPRA